MIFIGNLRFWAIFVGSSTRFFEKYAAFGALLMYLSDFSAIFTFWSSFGALLTVLWNFGDVFLLSFQLLHEFRWFWMDLFQNLTRFWCVILMRLVYLLWKFDDFYRKSTIASNFRRLQYTIDSYKASEVSIARIVYPSTFEFPAARRGNSKCIGQSKLGTRQ